MNGSVAAAAARLDRQELALLVDELHRRLGGGSRPVRVRLTGSSADERSALADLLGSPRLPAEPVVLPVAKVAAVLGLDSLEDLWAAIEVLRGPADDRRAARQALARERDELWAWLSVEAAGRPVVAEPLAWVDELRRSGIRGSVREHRTWLRQVLAVLDALPADAVTLAELAQDVLGHPHALDHGRSRAAAVLAAISPRAQGRRDAETVRAAWEGVGVAPDALSSSVLALGLGSGRDHPLASLWSASGPAEPVALTLAQLRRWPLPPLPATACAFVVENPSLLSAAARTGWDGPPVVCSSGRPTVAVLALLRQLTAEGAVAYQHADLDPVGVGITGWLVEHAGTVPWRMTAHDYLVTLDRPGPPAEEAAEAVSVPPTPWDPALQEAMTTRRVWTYEEQVRTDLLTAMLRTRSGQQHGEDPTA